jgi:hypothetical protein
MRITKCCFDPCRLVRQVKEFGGYTRLSGCADENRRAQLAVKLALLPDKPAGGDCGRIFVIRIVG